MVFLAFILVFMAIAGESFHSNFNNNHKTVLVTRAVRGLRPLEPFSSGEDALTSSGIDIDKQRQEVMKIMKKNEDKLKKKLLAPTVDDMKRMAFILANVSDALDTNPEVALSIGSQNMGWLFARDVPALTQMMLSEYPTLRQDKGMMRGYLFLVDFLEAIGKQTSNLLKKNQNAMKLLLEAMKVSENAINEVIESTTDLKSPEFLVYLDTEIEAQEQNGPMENLLVTIKLRLLEEIGKGMGYDTTILPKLAAEEDPAELKRKTIEHLRGYESVQGMELFVQALKMMKKEMRKRYTQVDPLLLINLDEVEKIAEMLIQREQTAEDRESK